MRQPRSKDGVVDIPIDRAVVRYQTGTFPLLSWTAALYDGAGSKISDLPVNGVPMDAFYSASIVLVRELSGPVGGVTPDGQVVGSIPGVTSETSKRWAAVAGGNVYVALADGTVGVYSQENLAPLGFLEGTVGDPAVKDVWVSSSHLYVASTNIGHGSFVGTLRIFSLGGVLVRTVALGDDVYESDSSGSALWINAADETASNTVTNRHSHVAALDGSNVVALSGFTNDPDVSVFAEGDAVVFAHGPYVYAVDQGFNPSAPNSENAVLVFSSSGSLVSRLPSMGAYSISPAGGLVLGLPYEANGSVSFWSLEGAPLGDSSLSASSAAVLGVLTDDRFAWIVAEGGTASTVVATVFDLGLCGGDPNAPRGTFADDDTSTFEADIEWLVAQGITKGCNPEGTLFCPVNPVTRGQMAAFLSRALGLPASNANPFTDVSGSGFETEIGKVAAAGITVGCNPEGTLFCPNSVVTRGEMAAFLARALNLPDGSVNLFMDDDGSIFEADIAKIAAAGITTGCTGDGTKFCPNDSVTRGQMAAFLHRALGD